MNYRITIDCDAPEDLDDAAQLLDEAMQWADDVGLETDDGGTVSVEHIDDSESGDLLSAAHTLHRELHRYDDWSELPLARQRRVHVLVDILQRIVDMGGLLVFDADGRELMGTLPAALWRANGWKGTVGMNSGLLQLNVTAKNEPPAHPDVKEIS